MKARACSPTMRKLLRYLDCLTDKQGITAPICCEVLLELSGLQLWIGKMALGRLCKERYIDVLSEGGVMCDEHDAPILRYKILPHVCKWLDNGAPHPGPPPCLVIRHPNIFLQLNEPDVYEGN